MSATRLTTLEIMPCRDVTDSTGNSVSTFRTCSTRLPRSPTPARMSNSMPNASTPSAKAFASREPRSSMSATSTVCTPWSHSSCGRWES